MVLGFRTDACEELNPPPDVDMEIPRHKTMQKPSRRLAIHSEDPYCYGCHQLTHWISFENYGALGEYRQIGKMAFPPDASNIAEGKFDHVTQMLTLLANSPKVQTCYVQMDGVCLGRPLEEEDQS